MVLCDRAGTRMPAVRATIERNIGAVYKGLDTTLECFPADDVADDPDAYKKVRKLGLLLRVDAPCPLLPAFAK
jgi:hypothetical protein